MTNKLIQFLLLFSVLIVLICSVSCLSDVSSTTQNNISDERTDKTQPLSPKEILVNQPDFTAEQQYFMFESHRGGGISIAGKLSKKGLIYRWESFDNVSFLRFDQPIVFCDTRGKNCSEERDYNDCCGYLKANQVENFAKLSDAIFELAGSEIVQDHDCIKIKVENVAKKETIYFYAAKDLKNLVIKTEITQSDRKHTFILSDISFDVPNQLFEPIETFNRKRI